MKLSADTKLGILTAICIVINIIVSKSVLYKPYSPTDIITTGPFWVYIGYLLSKDSMKESYRSPMYWGAVMMLVTLATILMYALFLNL